MTTNLTYKLCLNCTCYRHAFQSGILSFFAGTWFTASWLYLVCIGREEKEATWMAVNLGPQAEQLANGNSLGGPGVLSCVPFIFPLHFLPGSNLQTENVTLEPQ